MQIANCRLWLSKYAEIPYVNLTPAEAQILTHDEVKAGNDKHNSHRANFGKFPIEKLEIQVGKDGKPLEAPSLEWSHEEGVFLVPKNAKPRTEKEEWERLKRKYRSGQLSALFPGGSPKLPQKFSEVDGWLEADAKHIASFEPKVVEPAKPA